MGWCKGSYLANDIWIEVRSLLEDSNKRDFAEFLYTLFSDQDADCWDYELEIVQFLQSYNFLPPEDVDD